MGQLGQGLVGARPPHARPGDDDGPSRVPKDLHRLLHQIGVAQGPGVRPVGAVEDDVRGDGGELDVDGDVEEHRSLPPGRGVAERRGDVVAQPPHVVAGPGPLRDGRDQRDLVHLLERTHLELHDGVLAGEQEHR